MNSISLGIMSGTSLDGVDLALCQFNEEQNKWQFKILDAKTINYSSEWKHKLSNAPGLNANDFLLLHNEYGRFLGTMVNDFLKGKIKPDIISSHGHTIFHQPDKNFTFQLGQGASIAATTEVTTVSDFRTLDVALGGQGAPLVPIGDQLLFPEYDYCLNIGGFANISLNVNGIRVAYDICPVNIVLNELALKKNKPYDKDGEIGLSGKTDQSLLEKLNSLGYYKLRWPKSLGREWVDQNIFPLLSGSGLSVEDQASTYYEHVAYQISRVIGSSGTLLSTGGGTRNKFLMSKMKGKTSCKIIMSDSKLIDFKEALIFAFLGLLSFKGQNNCLSSVTGAKLDNIGGIINIIK